MYSLPSTLSTTASSSETSRIMSGVPSGSTLGSPRATGSMWRTVSYPKYPTRPPPKRSAGRIADDTPDRRAARGSGCNYSLAAGEPDEGIAAEALAAHDRLEKVRIGPVRKLGVQRERRIEIGAGLGENRDAGIALRGEPLKFELSHETLSNFCTRGNCLAAWMERDPEPRGDASGLAAPAAPATPGESLELCREGLHGGSDYTTAASRARMSRMVAA